MDDADELQSMRRWGLALHPERLYGLSLTRAELDSAIAATGYPSGDGCTLHAHLCELRDRAAPRPEECALLIVDALKKWEAGEPDKESLDAFWCGVIGLNAMAPRLTPQERARTNRVFEQYCGCAPAAQDSSDQAEDAAGPV